MVVTGSTWQSITLGELIPTLDPNREGSAAHRLNCEIGRISSSIDRNLKKVTNLTSSVAKTLNTVKELGNEIAILQNQIEDLITNAINTGVFMHTLGLDPIFSLRGPQEILSSVITTFQDTSDPNIPVFKGDGLAVIGGVLILVSAPNVQEMLAAVERLGAVFPVFRSALESISGEVVETANIFSEEFLTPVTTEIGNLTGTFKTLNAADLTTPLPEADLFEEAVENSEDVGFEGYSTGNVNKWFALRVSDLIPALDPSVEGSPAEAIVNAERAIVGGGAALLQQAGGLADGINELTQAVNFLNARLQRVATDVQDLVGAVSQTGLFTHTIGLDGSVTNSQQFIDAVARSLRDTTDSNRPRSSGQMQAFFGLEIVFGAANPAGLRQQFNTIGNVFGGLSTDVEAVGGAAGALF